MSKTLQGHCTELNKTKRTEALTVSSRGQTTVITLHKIVFRVPKITRTARTLYEINRVMWKYSYVGKHLEKR